MAFIKKLGRVLLSILQIAGVIFCGLLKVLAPIAVVALKILGWCAYIFICILLLPSD